MKLSSVRIQNFRALKDATVNFDDYTCFVGANGAGKSTVLCALNVFFRETENSSTDVTRLDKEDFFQKDTSQPIEITVTFTDLSPEAQEEFKNYYRSGKLIVSARATFNPETGKADVRQYGQRLGINDFRIYFEKEKSGAKLPDLQKVFSEIIKKYSDIRPEKTKDGMTSALHEYESAHPDLCTLIPSEDQFYGVSKGTNRLQKFIQWVYIPAIKDASKESVEAKDTALGKLLSRTVRSRTNFSEAIASMRDKVREEYQELLEQHQSVLEEVSSSLQCRLAEWAHPDAKVSLSWRQDPEKSVKVEEPWAHASIGEGNFDGQVTRLGHGLQRSYIIALLQELSATTNDKGPKLILACEEPELYQHPPQARHLAMVLRSLSENNAQIMVSTHSPYFVSGQTFESARLVRRDKGGAAVVSQATFKSWSSLYESAGLKPIPASGVAAKLHQVLQPSLAEMLFTPKLILVEGIEDAAYIHTYLELNSLWERFRRSGAHIVPTNKKSEMPKALSIAKCLNIPTFIIFDTDGNETNQEKRKVHERDNSALFCLSGHANQPPFPEDIFWSPTCVAWPQCLSQSIKGDIGEEIWESARQKAANDFNHAPDLQKNTMFIASHLSYIWDMGGRSPSLMKLCRAILDFAESDTEIKAESANPDQASTLAA